MEKGLWENGMNVACGMEMSISLKLCGAEVYVCNEGEMKCWFGRGTKPTGTNVARMERKYHKHTDKSTRHVFIFLQQLMGGGEFCGIECWKVGNKFYVFGTIFFLNGCRKIILTFQHSQLLSQSIFGMEWGRQKPLKWQKCFVAAVPIFENLLCFLIATRNIPSIKNTSGFRGFILGLAVRLNIAPIRCNYFPLCPIGRFVGVNSSLKIKKYHWKCVEEGLWENGMHVACGMEMSISLKLCGAEVYACNVSKMKYQVSK